MLLIADSEDRQILPAAVRKAYGCFWREGYPVMFLMIADRLRTFSWNARLPADRRRESVPIEEEAEVIAELEAGKGSLAEKREVNLVEVLQ